MQQALDALQNGFLATTELEHQALTGLYRSLLEDQGTEKADRYCILQDLMSYAEVQRKVEELFLNPMKWATYCLHNIAGMGFFSTDESIHLYAGKVWGLKSCPVSPLYLDQVRAEYSEHDKCRIL